MTSMSQALQVRCVANARLHQHLRCLDRAERKHHFDSCADAVGCAAIQRSLRRSARLPRNVSRVTSAFVKNRQVRLVHDRIDVRTEN